MESQQELRTQLDLTVAKRDSLPSMRGRWTDRYPSDSPVFRRTATKAWCAQMAEYKLRLHFGKFRRALVLGTAVLGPTFVRELDQAGFLLAGQVPNRSFATCLRDLARYLGTLDRSAALSHLAQRVQTYRAYHGLLMSVHARTESVRRALAQRPFPFGKTAISMLNLCFLRAYFGFEIGAEYSKLFEEHTNPERFAEAVSAIIALSNEQLPLEVSDFSLPSSGIDVSDEFVEVLRYGAAKCALRDAAKLISVFGYELVRTSDVDSRVYELRPPDRQLEYAIRLGFVRSEVGNASGSLYVARRTAVPLLSMLTAAETLLRDVPEFVEVAGQGTPLHRMRFCVPMAPDAFERLSRLRFYEDVLFEERLSQELELPMGTSDTNGADLVPGVDISTFLQVWRNLAFLAVLDITALRQFQADPTVFYNSLMRSIPRESFSDLLSTLGMEHLHLSALVELIGADVNKLGFYDTQYRPFLCVNSTKFSVEGRDTTFPATAVFASSLVATTNIVANVQRAHGIRFKGNADEFVNVVADSLREIFPNVRKDSTVKCGSECTDIDVLVLTERTLYVIECKHSVTPTSMHELRDLWRDINHGADQLKRAMGILRERLHDYMAGWFPGTKKRQTSDLRIQPCVLCSHRALSGLSIDGIPIRDFASLTLVLGDAIVGVGSEDESGELVMQRYRLRETRTATQRDLDEYLSDGSRFFQMFEPFMREFSRRERLMDGDFTLVHRTFAFAVSQEEWVRHVEGLGAIRVSDERRSVRELQPDHGADAALKVSDTQQA